MTTPTILALLGSARGDGNTARLLAAVTDRLDRAETIDLSTLAIGPYAYDNRHADDDFLPLARRMQAADAIVFASPVYWYAMSAPMKTVFDRLTDLITVQKALGRSLAGKAIFAVSTGGSPAAPASFTQPFADTADYFGMRWGGLLYAEADTLGAPETQGAATAFAARIRDLAALSSAS